MNQMNSLAEGMMDTKEKMSPKGLMFRIAGESHHNITEMLWFLLSGGGVVLLAKRGTGTSQLGPSRNRR